MSAICNSCLRTAANRRSLTSTILVPLAGPGSTSQIRWSGTTTPKRPSPYRLIPISTFLADFAPLHVQGWRLDSLYDASSAQAEKERSKESGMVELQDRRLVRRYDFEQGKEGWRRLMTFTQKAGEVVEAEDHHPTILISPSSDYRPTNDSNSIPAPMADTTGYVLAISTHTHTPLPPLKYPKAANGSQDTMRPGVTGKDLKLANALEGLYQSTIDGAT